MLFSTHRAVQFPGFLLQNCGIIRFKPVPFFSGNPEVSSRFSVDPAVQIDPVFDLFRTFAVPGHIFGKVSVRLCGIIAEAFQHINSDLFLLPEFFVVFESFQESGNHIFAVVFYGDIPGLMIDACADNVQFLPGYSKNLRNLHFPVDFSVAETYGFHPAVLIAGPGSHGVWIGIIQHNGSRLGHIPDIPAEIQHFRNHSLAVHDSACTQSISHTLIHSVFQGDLDVCLKCFQPADADAVYDISGISEGLPSVRGGRDFYRNIVGIQISLAQRPGFLQIVRIDIREGNLNVMKFRNRHDIGKQGSGKNKTSRSDKCNFKTHEKPSVSLCFVHYSLCPFFMCNRLSAFFQNAIYCRIDFCVLY